MLRKTICVAAVALIAVSAAGGELKADLARQMPADCLGFVVTRNLQTLGGHLREFLTPLGAADKTPPFDDEEALAEDIGIPKIFDIKKNWGLLFLPPQGAGLEPRVVIILPVKDWGKAKKQLGNADDDGIYTISPGEGREPILAMRYRRYLAVADKHLRSALVALSGVKKRYSPSRAASEILSRSEVFAHINVKALLAAYKGQIEFAKQMLSRAVASAQKAEAESGPESASPMPAPRPPAKLLRLMPGAMDVLLDALNQVEAVDIGADVGEEGLTLKKAVTFHADGSIARALGVLAPLKRWVPPLAATDDFVVAGWMRVDMEKLVGEYLALVGYLDTKMGLKDALGAELIDELKNSITRGGRCLGNNLAMVISAPPAEEKRGIFAYAAAFEVTDAKMYRRELARRASVWPPLLEKMFENLGQTAPKISYEYKPKAEQIAGIRVDHVKSNVDFLMGSHQVGATPEEAKKHSLEMINIIYGPEGLLSRFAIVDDEVVATLGGKVEMERALAAVTGEQPSLAKDDALKRLAKKMPKHAAAIAFISIPRYVGAVMRMGQEFAVRMMPPGTKGPPMPKVEVPKTDSAAVVALAVRRNVCRIDMHVPMAEVVATTKMLAPALLGALQAAYRAKSAANLRQIGLGLHTYAATFRGKMPPDLHTLLQKGFAADKRLFENPSRKKHDPTGDYAYVAGLGNLRIQELPPGFVIAYEKVDDLDKSEGLNVLFVDGHVEWMEPAAFKKALKKTQDWLAKRGKAAI